MPLGETLPRARVIRAIQALGLDPAITEQVILDPAAVRIIETSTDEDGQRIGADYITALIVDALIVDAPSEEQS